MIPKKFLDSVLDKSIILTITAPNDNAKSISVQCAGWALAHPEFGSSVNPITTRGADYAQCITASPPGFENLVAALYNELEGYAKLNYLLPEVE